MHISKENLTATYALKMTQTGLVISILRGRVIARMKTPFALGLGPIPDLHSSIACFSESEKYPFLSLASRRRRNITGAYVSRKTDRVTTRVSAELYLTSEIGNRHIQSNYSRNSEKPKYSSPVSEVYNDKSYRTVR